MEKKGAYDIYIMQKDFLARCAGCGATGATRHKPYPPLARCLIGHVRWEVFCRRRRATSCGHGHVEKTCGSERLEKKP